MEIGYLSRLIENIWGIKRDRIVVKPLEGDASDRSYYRIFIGDITVIGMEFSPLESGESSFTNVLTHLKGCGIGVPDLYYSDLKNGLILLEDVGDLTLERIFYNKDEYLKYYYKAIDELLKLQIRASRFNPRCSAFRLFFDVDKFMEEFELFLNYLIEDYKGIRIRSGDRKALRKYFLDISELLARQPLYFTHRDYHSRNIMIKDERIKLIDFQDARMGLCQYDLASLLRDSYVSLKEEIIRELLEYYVDQKEEIESVKINMEEFVRLFDFTSIQRNLKACGTFAFLYKVKNKKGYARYIKNTLKYVKRNLEKYEELLPLKRLLEGYLEELS